MGTRAVPSRFWRVSVMKPIVWISKWCVATSTPMSWTNSFTNGSRSIPIVIALDQEFRTLGHWGPRPQEIQEWVVKNKDKIPSNDRYPMVRKWYARDRGLTTLKEVLGMLER